jgi:hypothetical protein
MQAGRRQRVAGGGQTPVLWRLSRSVIDSVGPAGAEFARNADSARSAAASSWQVDRTQIILSVISSAPSIDRLSGRSGAGARWQRLPGGVRRPRSRPMIQDSCAGYLNRVVPAAT